MSILLFSLLGGRLPLCLVSQCMQHEPPPVFHYSSILDLSLPSLPLSPSLSLHLLSSPSLATTHNSLLPLITVPLFPLSFPLMEVLKCGDSPCLAFGASASVDCGRLLLWHGGTKKEGGQPTGNLVLFDTTHEKWSVEQRKRARI